MNHSVIRAALSCILIPSALLQAAWHGLESFEGQASSITDLENWAELTLVKPDPLDPDNRVLSPLAEVYDTGPARGALSLPVPIPEDLSATFYLRLLNPADESVTAGLRIGLTDVPLEELITQGQGPTTAVGVTILGGEEAAWTVRPISIEGVAEPLPPGGQWVELWMHIIRPNDVFEVYIRAHGEQEANQVVLAHPDHELPLSQFPFRGDGVSGLVTVQIDHMLSGAGNPLVDDLAIYTGGLALETPGKWGPWLRSGEDSGFIDTHDWLGWLYSSGGDYMYSYQLESYIFLPEEHLSQSGAWGFAPR